ncbi:sensor histidine kinase, partial [Ruminococcus sp.]|uniref:sensor histidine kinase n=1 Tax=Ruminococcus sp. TaxID=41978 RepID=UPI003864C8C2
CVAILILVSFFFTKRLVNHIMIPVTLLEKGANRIQENVLTEKIVYNGDKEFENICNTFNTMQEHILSEQEKNKKYEQARTEMIAGISHDLKTPLTAIKGTIKSLIDGVVTTPEQEEKFLKTAYRRTNDMDALLNQLFYLSKLETGNMPLNLTKTDLKSFIKNYVDNLNANLFDEQIEAITHIDCEECITYIDSELFKRVLDNLTENSKKYCNASPIKIEITLKQKDNNLLIGFSDNGIGVSEDKITHIFDEFYRADESRNVCKGNGLGLYIVKKIVESMQGKVYAKNENGLSIYIELPKARN